MEQNKGRVGKPVDRVDGRLKVTDGARYAAEFRQPRMAYAALVQSTVARGKITAIDCAAAEKLPGTLAVITHKNAPKIHKPPPNPRGAGEQSPGSYLMLQDDRVHFWGQHVAVVVADTPEGAFHAASLVRITYDPEPARTDFAAELKNAKPPEGGKVHDQPADTERGQPEKALADAAVKVDHVYTTARMNHNPIEPHATVAVWDGPKLTVHDATQYIAGVRRSLAQGLGIPKEDVRVVCPFTGGGFGCKGATWPHVLLAAVAARHVGRPVQLALTRAQMFTSVGYRPPTRQRVALGATRDGKLTTVIHEGVSQSAPFGGFVEPVALMARMMYASDAAATRHRVAVLDDNSPTYMRAPGEASGSFALEAAMDELAYGLKLDPLELRLRNHADKGPGEDKPFSSKSLKECYRVAAERFGWAKRTPEPRSMRDGDALVGWGMASATYPVNRFPTTARVSVLADGTGGLFRGTGVLGPRTRTERLFDDMAARGQTADRRVHGPVGLDLGAETPEQIALALVAEVQAVLAGREGGLLSRQAGPIHERPPDEEGAPAGWRLRPACAVGAEA
jgi:xanthine dehydrogenase YagR molybdenum-binding subunit